MILTLTELEESAISGVDAEDIEVAKRIVALFMEKGRAPEEQAILVSWKNMSRGKGRTVICNLEEMRIAGRRILIRVQVWSKLGRSRISTYASSIVDARLLSDTEIDRMTKARGV